MNNLCGESFSIYRLKFFQHLNHVLMFNFKNVLLGPNSSSKTGKEVKVYSIRPYLPLNKPICS